MKIKCSVLALFVLAAWNLRADDFQITERGPDYRVWSKTTVENGTNQVHQYMELATGLYYTNSSGELTESREEISPLPGGGAAAIQGRHQVYFPSDIYDGVIEVVTPDGRHLKSRPLGVSYDDGSNTVWIARLKHSEGELVSSNQVIYPDAFTDFKADLVCTYRRGSFESDLVCRESPPTPNQYGLNNASATLQLVTEFFDTADPREKTGQADKKYKLQDKTLKFGDLTMIQGKAFSVTTTNTVSPHRISVYKSWVHTQNRTFLIEEVPVKYLANDLSTLPASTNVQGSKITGKLRMASNQRQWLPTHQIASRKHPMQIAAIDLNQKSGVVLDYCEIDTDQTDFTFVNGETYLISGPVNLGDGSEDGTSVVFNGGSVIKFTADASSGINYDQYDASYPTDPALPAVFTSKDDDSVGETICGSTGNPIILTNVSYLANVGAGGNNLANMDFYYAGVGMDANDVTYIYNCRFFNCFQAIQFAFGEVDLFNCLFSACYIAVDYDFPSDVPVPYAYVYAQNVTADNGTFYTYDNFYSQTDIDFGSFDYIDNFNYIYANSLFTRYENPINSYTEAADIFESSYELTNSCYESADKANYYLAPGSPYRDIGITNINPTLLAELRTMTTYAPQDGGFPDTNTPDIGYHYPTNEDSDYDGIPDWWIWQNFGNYDENGPSLDSVGNTLLYDYLNGLDPNLIAFSISNTNEYVNTSAPVLPLTIGAGIPFYMTVLVNDFNHNDAVWVPYNTNLVANIDSGDGGYNVEVGLRGWLTNSSQAWSSTYLILETIPPSLTVTNPYTGCVSNSIITLQGFANESLESLTFDISNATGVSTGQLGFLTGSYYDNDLSAYTTNYFACPNLGLSGGANLITLHAKDLAGNGSDLNLLLNDVINTNQPLLSLTWPADGMVISSDTFTLQAQVDNPQDSITATIVDAYGNTNTVQGLVEIDGVVWVQNVPLNDGNNEVILNATAPSGASNAIAFTVVGNDIGLTIDPLTQLNQSSVTVTGSIGDPADDCVFVNGVQAYYTTGGDWEADNVPVSPNGTASLNVQVYTGDPVLIGSQTENIQQPPTVQITSYTYRNYFDSTSIVSYGGDPTYGFLPYSYSVHVLDDLNVNWADGIGGQYRESGWSDNIPGPINNEGTIGPDQSDVVGVWVYPWLYADVGSIPEPDATGSWSRYCRVDTMIAPGGQQSAGITNVYLVRASAVQFTNAEDQLGSLPLPPKWLQINGVTLFDTQITNDDGSVSGETILPAPAGEKVDITPVATEVSQDWEYFFSEQVFDVTPRMAVDYDRNGQISFQGDDLTTSGNPYRFWIDDAQENGDVSSSQYYVPGASSPNYENSQVNGRSDLINFFPISLSMSNALQMLPATNGYEFHLSQADSAIKIVYSSLAPANAFDYLTNVNSSGYGSNADEAALSADTIQVTSSGIKLDTNFLNEVQGNGGFGVLLAEGCSTTTSPLMLEIWHDGQKVAATPLNLSIDGVEQMYRWINLRHVLGQTETKTTDTDEPANYPDSICDGKQLIFVHGYSVSETAARGWGAEMFKRLYQSDSKAMFTAITWYGNNGQIDGWVPFAGGVTLDYYTNVANAFLTASNLAEAASALPGQKYIAGHSLGNMVVSSAIADWGLDVNSYFMLDAAVAIEAYNASANDNLNLVSPPYWISYSNRLWASKWYTLFDSSDARSSLTWSNRFGNLPNAHNYYSSTEDVLKNADGTLHSIFSPAYAWVNQEMLKGSLLIGLVVNDEAGWGFNIYYSTNTISQADLIPDSQLRTNSFFGSFDDANLYGIDGSAEAANQNIRGKVLADGIPALSNPAGSNPLGISVGDNHDMNSDKGLNADGLWPRSLDDWEHSDIINIAYPFNHAVFNHIVTDGGFQ